MKLYCATTNPGKLREFHTAVEHFAPGVFDLKTVPGMRDIAPCEETGLTFEENAAEKALYYSRHAPGVVANNELLLERLRGVADRTSRFVCVVALAGQGQVLGTFRGTVEGRIIDEARGPNGFGYDPLFYYPDFACTFGEATHAMKLTVSHRSRAVEQMVRFLIERRLARRKG
jgi:XTP/dITP diphosphohydrolase